MTTTEEKKRVDYEEYDGDDGGGIDAFISLGRIILATGEYMIYDVYDDDESDEEHNRQPDRQAILFHEKEIKILYNYPLSYPRIITYRRNNGFTRGAIIDIIVEEYKKIYATDESREEWGVYGHELGDLLLHTVCINRNGVIVPCIDS